MRQAPHNWPNHPHPQRRIHRHWRRPVRRDSLLFDARSVGSRAQQGDRRFVGFAYRRLSSRRWNCRTLRKRLSSFRPVSPRCHDKREQAKDRGKRDSNEESPEDPVAEEGHAFFVGVFPSERDPGSCPQKVRSLNLCNDDERHDEKCRHARPDESVKPTESKKRRRANCDPSVNTDGRRASDENA